ncbi:ribosomal protein S5 domain 2-type protein [Dimargaris cristalligena]|uniref:Ribosomal RNA-processing protein 42 n=1 Tax=Dimargaris cristalligena TaxID=215637 RepID=A0A4P9ZKW1_9FUNG|nr:ribosomal protein S5 domain 2-type protein [Dimargaris cristalligena]|eukprot:RKP33708.1 ribosomal protein S5 domain 2-type protein [Dimargaris cristalligena]
MATTGLISPAEINYIREGFAVGIRADGRALRQYREYLLGLDVISHSSGSARCRIGFGTDVLVGVKVEVSNIEPGEVPNRGKVVCNVECSPSTTQNWDSRAADELNNELTQFLHRCLNDYDGIDLEKLCIIPNQSCWILYVDALVLDFGGNLYDTLLMAVRAALFNTRIPKVHIEETGDDGEKEFDVIDDPEEAEPVPGWADVPLAVTLNWANQTYFVDASEMEEHCTDAKLTVTVNKNGHICAIQKSGLGAIPQKVYPEMLTVRIRQEWGVPLALWP